MGNDDLSPRRPLGRGERRRIGIFEPFRWGGLPGFWLYFIGAIVATSAIAIGGAWLLTRMGIE